MAEDDKSVIPSILEEERDNLLTEWQEELARGGVRRDDLMKEAELRAQCQEFLTLLIQATAGESRQRLALADGAAWAPLHKFLQDVSRSRAMQGFTPTQTATYILSFKKPLFSRLRQRIKDARSLADETWTTTEMLDRLALTTIEAYQKTREDIIARQQQDMLELSTPVVKLWDGVLALPMIGTLDSARTQVVMESLLQRIVETGAEIAIIDITGVPTVDTLVAQHLLKTVTAARLMGADCIISGIRPQIAQTIVHLGVSLRDVTTKASLADAFNLALQRTGFRLEKNRAQ